MWPVLCCRLEIPGLCSDLCSSWMYFFPVYFWVVLWTTCVYPLPVSCCSACSLVLRHYRLTPSGCQYNFQSVSQGCTCLSFSALSSFWFLNLDHFYFIVSYIRLRKLLYSHLGCEPEAHNTPSFLCLQPLRLCWLVVVVVKMTQT